MCVCDRGGGDKVRGGVVRGGEVREALMSSAHSACEGGDKMRGCCERGYETRWVVRGVCVIGGG